MPVAYVDRTWFLSVFLNIGGTRKIPTPAIDYNAFLFFRNLCGSVKLPTRDRQNYFGMYAQVLSTGQAQTHEPTLLCFLLVCLGSLYSVFHQSLEFRQRLFDFRDCSRAVDEFALCRIELWTRCVKSRVCVTSNRITC